MSLGLALQSAISSLQLNQRAMTVTSSNIANVNTRGYTRKIQGQESRILGGLGTGVRDNGITRRVDQFLIKDIRRESSLFGALAYRTEILRQTQDFFGTPSSNTGINAAINQLGTALSALSINPDDNVAQLDFLTYAQETARQVRFMNTELQGLRSTVDQEINDTVNSINTLLNQIHDLNVQISQGRAGGNPTPELDDIRDTYVEDLSELINVSTLENPTGSLSIIIGGVVVVDQVVKEFSYSPQSSVAPGTTFSNITLTGFTDASPFITNGRLSEQLALRDTTLPNMAAQLDTLARTVFDEMNAIHNLGTSFPPPSSLTGSVGGFTGAEVIGATTTGVLRVAVTDANGDIIDDGTGNPAYRDIDLGALGAGATITDVVNAINAVPYNTLLTASINADGQLQIVGAGTNRIALTEVTAVDFAGSNQGFSHYFGLNDLFTADTAAVSTDEGAFAGSLNVSAFLQNDPQRVASTRLGTGTYIIGDNAISIGDGSNALALADKLGENLAFAASGGLPTMSRTLAGYASAIITDSANKVAKAETDMDVQRTVVENLIFRLKEDSGVDIDQELSQMIEYENAYNASARVISTIQRMFDELERIV